MANSIPIRDPMAYPKLARALVLPKKLNGPYRRLHTNQALRWLALQIRGSVERAGSPAKDFQ